MHLIAKDIADLGDKILATYCASHRLDPRTIFNDVDRISAGMTQSQIDDYSTALDFGASGWIASHAKTFLFDTPQVLEFLRSIDRKLAPGDYRPPFTHMAFQFSQGIDEKLFLTGLRSNGTVEESDKIICILLSVPDTQSNPEHSLANVVAYYESTSLNRVQIPLTGSGEIVYAPIGSGDEKLKGDKQRIANLAMLLLAYIDTPGMHIEHVTVAEKVNRKRARDGKRVLPDYYICRWKPAKGTKSAGGAELGTSHSFRYDVAGHYRQLPSGKLIWIRPHQRGVENEVYKPKVYRVD